MTLRFKSVQFYLKLWCYLLPIISFAIARYIRFDDPVHRFSSRAYQPEFYMAVSLLATLIWSFIAQYYRLNSIDELLRENTGAVKTFSAVISTYLFLALILFFYRQQSLSRAFLIISALILFTTTLFGRLVFRRLLHRTCRDRSQLRILVIGADAYARNFGRRLSSMPFVAPTIVGYVRAPGQDVELGGEPVVELSQLLAGPGLQFNEIVIAIPPAQMGALGMLARALMPLGKPIRTALDLGGFPVACDRVFQLGELHLVDLATTPIESPAYFILKRTIDIAISVVALSSSAPLMLLIAVAIKLTSAGPVLFRQERVGLNGRAFTMYKFRTMREGTRSEGDTRWTVANDERRTRVGVLLRRSSFDEIPQFFNVLKGDMSVVGPRPERPFFVEKFLTEVTQYNARHSLKVGITGWAQVNGWRGDSSITKRLEFDLYYLQNWSLWFDMRIMFLTVWWGLFGRNAY